MSGLNKYHNRQKKFEFSDPSNTIKSLVSKLIPLVDKNMSVIEGGCSCTSNKPRMFKGSAINSKESILLDNFINGGGILEI